MRLNLRPLHATDQLAVNRRWPALLPGLMRKGLSLQDAAALAHNVTFLFYALELDAPPRSPADLLDHFSLSQIARLCEAYRERAEQLEQLALPDSDEPQEVVL